MPGLRQQNDVHQYKYTKHKDNLISLDDNSIVFICDVLSSAHKNDAIVLTEEEQIFITELIQARMKSDLIQDILSCSQKPFTNFVFSTLNAIKSALYFVVCLFLSSLYVFCMLVLNVVNAIGFVLSYVIPKAYILTSHVYDQFTGYFDHRAHVNQRLISENGRLNFVSVAMRLISEYSFTQHT